MTLSVSREVANNAIISESNNIVVSGVVDCWGGNTTKSKRYKFLGATKSYSLADTLADIWLWPHRETIIVPRPNPWSKGKKARKTDTAMRWERRRN